MWDIVEEHLDEAAFLSAQWERALVSPRYRLAKVAEGPEARLLANLDGMAHVGPAVVPRLLDPRLSSESPEEVFAAALARCERPDDALDWVAPLFQDEGSPSCGPVLRALGLARKADLGRALRGLLEQSPPPLQAGALSALALRGEPVDDLLPDLTKSESPAVKAAVLRAIREPSASLHTFAEYALDSPEPEVRDAALEAGLLMGLPSAMQSARRAVEAQLPDTRFAFTALAASGEMEDAERLIAALAAPKLRAGVVVALGFSGWPKAAEACLPLMADESVARLAGEAFSRVTGLALEDLYVREEEAADDDEPIPFDEEDLEADLVPGPEADLPVPDAETVERWWRAEQRRFSPKLRYHRGKPLGPEVLWEALGRGPMRGRDVLAFEVALRTGGAARVETRTWAFLQRRALASGLRAGGR